MCEPRAHFSDHDPGVPVRPETMLGTHEIRMTATGDLFAWRGEEVVLLAERLPSAFVVARGWVYGDRLVTVRRWSFASAAGLVGQIRRLTRDATGSRAVADDAAEAALAWARGLHADPG